MWYVFFSDTSVVCLFQISGFPNVLGCIDGSYIPIRKPKHKIRSTYVNRHDSLSITLQGICDANLKFIDVYTGVPSKIHDSRVLKLSFIGKDLPRKCFPNYHLLGDSAYQLREHLLTPYKDYGNLTEGERIFNKKFCATRVKIENAFGKLKGRFRQLMRLDFHNVEIMAKFIMACCAMHNLCIDNNDTIDDELQDTSQQANNINNFDEDNDASLMQLGRSKRKTIENLFLNS